MNRRELSSFGEVPTFREAVERAGLAERFNGERWVRLAHQCGIPRHVLEIATERLLAAAEKMAKCCSFHLLFVAVGDCIGDIHGIGELTVSDTAARIGQWLKLEPDKVYLHSSGTRVGARRLGLDWRVKRIEPRDLPKPMWALPPWQVEDILCLRRRKLGPPPVRERRSSTTGTGAAECSTHLGAGTTTARTAR